MLQATLALALAASAASAPLPNIIFMILDDMDSRLNALDVMPHYVQRLQKEGLSLPNAFVASPKCCPSRTSLLSGRFAHNLNDTQLGWCGDFIAAKRWNDTFIEGVKRAGYRTGLFGKVVNEMGPLCNAKTASQLPAGFDLAQGDRYLAMCNEVRCTGAGTPPPPPPSARLLAALALTPSAPFSLPCAAAAGRVL